MGGPLAVVAFVALGAVLLRKPAPPAPVDVRIPVRSQPMGATVLVDGKDTGVVTNGEVVVPAPAPPQVVLTFHKDGQRDEKLTVWTRQKAERLGATGGKAVRA